MVGGKSIAVMEIKLLMVVEASAIREKFRGYEFRATFKEIHDEITGKSIHGE